MERYWIGAKSQLDAVQIALKHELRRKEWRRAHGGKPSRLLDGIRVTDRKYLIGEFTPEERWILTAHLPGEPTDGEA